MNSQQKTYEELSAELQELRLRLREAEDTLDAVRSGAVDALVVSGFDGPKVFTLSGADEIYRIFFQEMADGGLTVNAQGTILFSNQRLSEILGSPSEKLLGDRFQHFIIYDDIEALEAALKKVFKDKTKADIVLRTNQNKIVRSSIVAIEPRNPSSGQSACIVVADITESKRLEMERRHLLTQKLESLRTMAGGIAHDFNNQLMAVLGNLELALDDTPSNSMAEANIKKAIHATETSAALSRQMLTYAGSSLFSHVILDINVLLNEDIFMMQKVGANRLILNLADGGSLPRIKGDPDQIRRLLINILNNASEAIADNDGQITVKTGVIDCDETCLNRSQLDKKPKPGPFVFLEVSDTGCGMDAETLHRVLDPFFTTKFIGRGLGMAEVMGIVKGHDGAITVDSEVGKGSTIRVLFPVFQKTCCPLNKTERVAEPHSSAAGSPSRKKTILVVEDEEMIRELVVSRLKVLGYDTMQASDGVEGIGVFRDRTDEIDLVLLDFVMPRMNGAEVFEELILIKPDVKVILSSGYSEDVVLERLTGRLPAGILQKPYKMQDLRSVLGRLLGSG